MGVIAATLPDGQRGLLLFILACLVLMVVYRSSFSVKYPKNLPLIGEPDGARSFSWRTRKRYYTDCGALYREAYDKYVKNGKAVLVPGLGFRDDIIMPQSTMKWVLSQPEQELSHGDAILEVVQLKHGLGHEKYKADPWPGMLVKTDINANLELICAELNDELSRAFDEYLGHDTESWKEVDLLPTVRKIIVQAASRFTVGKSLCRNEEYLAACMKVHDGIVLNGALTGASPKPLRPLLGPLFSWKLHRDIQSVRAQFEPLLHDRLRTIETCKDDFSEQPRDFLQMMLRYAQDQRPHELHDVDVLTRRLCFANFASMHQTTILVTNVLLNIVGSDSEYNTISALREEFRHIFDSDDNMAWTKAKVARMVKADSVAREKLRLNSFSNRGLFRKVMIDGIVTPEGIELPKGALISFLGHPLQCDPGIFDNPFHYDPHRFSRMREASADADGKPRLPNLSFVSTSPEHLPFGHGSHSCLGRFLVDFEVKMIISKILSQYDVEFPPNYNGTRPANVWITEAFAPPPGAKLRVRKQKISKH